ncbi:tryptophan-rich sensory protein [Arthrobacter sp. 24S4-2]|uniref:TspO/MBR family protein n=1 Tax=Arthrobacter sp. 24S4-2 TaxID=2575374 RepID=UPI0010C7DA7F|nr:TspO/MBR family protein [Arthrobacter sp. 24S4-2]QCO97084.1 tryptophan-rich sensory protein [Arthrobacter sp. 24S4-2]
MQAHHEQSMARPGGRPGATSRSGSAVKDRSIGAQVLGLAVFLGASALVAWLGALATLNNVNGWYVAADKAPWSPPNWVFGPVWTVLYAAMAVAAWLVWRRRAERSTPALVAYGIQLLLNLLWTPVFFGLYPVMGTAALWLGLAIIIALILAVTVTVLYFGPISRAAGLLLLPYVSWLVFAASLNWWAALHN